MFVHSLALSNVLSFGPEQRLEDLRQFNLLIGKNGVGKTNTIRVLGALGYKLGHISGQISVQQGQVQKRLQAYLVELEHDFRCDRLPHGYGVGDIAIDYTTSWRTNGGEARRSIVFRAGELVEGNVEELKHTTQLILPEWDDISFSNSIERDLQQPASPLLRNAKLNFGLTYIFERSLTVFHPGFLSEGHTRDSDGRFSGGGGVVTFNRGKWSQGMLRVAKMINQISVDTGLCLLEEPELHLEPRAIRRFIHFLTWLTTPKSGITTNRLKSLEAEWQAYVDDRRGLYHLNEENGIESKNQNRQFVVASHSSVLIQEFLALGDSAAIFDFDVEWMDNGFNPNVGYPTGMHTQADRDRGWAHQETLFTRVHRVGNLHHQLLENLGCTGADLLQCNGVVWVEGPSDVIYLEKWLEMYAKENGLDHFIRGQHFEFQMYGGSILDSLCLIKQGLNEEDEKRKLVEMFSFSRNAYIVADSDAVLTSDGDTRDVSSFFAAKQFLRSEVVRLNAQGYKLGMWYAENDTDLRTIENYLDESSNTGIPTSLSKKIKAQRVVARWGERKQLDEFPLKLASEIERLYQTVQTWQG